VSTEQSKNLVRRFFDDVLNNANLAAIDDLVTPDYVLHFTGSPVPVDREGHKGFVAALRAAFPDWQESIDDVIAEGDKVVARVTGRGTHRAEFMGIPATGRRVEITSINIDRIAGDRIAERWLLADVMGMMQQLGAVPTTK
jgi:steroid delta-isomerase-like uncharacterized protein